MRKTKEMWEAEVAYARRQGFEEGVAFGEQKAKASVSAQRVEAQLKMISAIGQTIHSCAMLADNMGGLR